MKTTTTRCFTRMLVLGFVGMPGSGKSIAIDALRKRDDTLVVVMGDMVRRAVEESGLEITPTTLGEKAKELRESLGKDAVARLTIDAIKSRLDKEKIKVVVIDGIRSLEEVACFRKEWDLKIVAIHSPPAVRHARLAKRHRADDSDEPGYFSLRDAREMDFGIARVIAMAEHVILNDKDTTIDSLQEKVVQLVEHLLDEEEARNKGRPGARNP